MLLAQAPLASAVSLNVLEEPTTALVSPPNANPFVTSMQYGYASGAFVATTVTSTPLMCANTHAPLAAGTTLNPVYYSANGIGGTTPKPFVFGASSTSPSVSAMASGATGGQMTSSWQFTGDPTGSLVCYGLDANGTRRLTRDIFLDGNELVGFNSSVSLSVFHVPANSTDFYGYTIDVTIPPLPAGTDCSATGLDCNFVLQEGYDTSVFATNSGGWCAASAGATSCPASTTMGNVNITTLPAPVAPAVASTYHFVVFRYFASGVNSLPATGAPVTLAALFSPNDLEENKLDDNVAAGNNQLANAAGSIVQNDGSFLTFATGLASLTESSDSGPLSFNITDADSAESVGHQLSASVSLSLPGGVTLPVAADCSTLLSNSGQVPVTRTCTIDIPLNNPNAWDGAVAANLQGLFNTFATDTTNNVYAPGITAKASIVVTDAAGKSSTPTLVNLHVHSSTNNPPVIAYGSSFPSVTDPNDNNSYPTYSCSVAAGAGTGGCGASGRSFIEVDMAQVLTAAPGPAGAFDELASQTTDVVPFSDPSGGNVQCTEEQDTPAFYSGGGPIVAVSGGLGSMNFLIPTAPPASAVSAICTLTITDKAVSFPNGETAQTASMAFRLVINP
jgi:hypothetical protein